MKQSIERLIQQAKELITEIESRPEIVNLEYSPDVTLSDAKQSLDEVLWELQQTTIEEN